MLDRAIVLHELRLADVEPSRRETSKIGCRQAERNPSKREQTSQILLPRALVKHPEVKSKIIYDNGLQLIAQDCWVITCRVLAEAN